jgi:hypothetical protein
MHLDTSYIYIHNKNYVRRKAKTTYNLKRIEYYDYEDIKYIFQQLEWNVETWWSRVQR